MQLKLGTYKKSWEGFSNLGRLTLISSNLLMSVDDWRFVASVTCLHAISIISLISGFSFESHSVFSVASLFSWWMRTYYISLLEESKHFNKYSISMNITSSFSRVTSLLISVLDDSPVKFISSTADIFIISEHLTCSSIFDFTKL